MRKSAPLLSNISKSASSNFPNKTSLSITQYNSKTIDFAWKLGSTTSFSSDAYQSQQYIMMESMCRLRTYAMLKQQRETQANKNVQQLGHLYSKMLEFSIYS